MADREIDRKKKEGTRVHWGDQRTKKYKRLLSAIRKYVSKNGRYVSENEKSVLNLQIFKDAHKMWELSLPPSLLQLLCNDFYLKEVNSGTFIILM